MGSTGMRLFRSYLQLPDSLRNSVVVLGNFDGMHRGHQEVIRRGGEIARGLGGPLTVLTFEPHPRDFFCPQDIPFRLTTFRIKERQLEALGVDALVVVHFDESFRLRSAGDFVSEVLVGSLATRHVVAGATFRFGFERTGDMARLAAYGAEYGFDVTSVDLLADRNGKPLSSTRVRNALIGGNPREAASVLGRAWEIEGRVELGDRIGRTLDFPTANIHLGEHLRPANGVYAVRAGVDTGLTTVWHDGIANFGIRPTVSGTDERLEVHFFDFSQDLYGRHLRVQLIDYLRPEQRFNSIGDLRVQIGLDVAAARNVLQQDRGTSLEG
ncbi:MAG: bifunctional riboflavin kinase/FAD synthetase [Rhodospirillaceae bacterium]